MVTIKDIAKLAGVSFSTVSKALNNSPLVKESTRLHVLKIAEQLNYRKNLLAKQLVSGKSGMIGLIWKTVDNPVYAHLAMELHGALQELQYEMVLTLAEGEQAMQLYDQLRVDGLIYWGDLTEKDRPLAKRFHLLDIPVLLMGSNESSLTPSVQIDRKAGIYQAIRYLVSYGHRRIGLIGNQPEKVQSFKEAVLDFELEFSSAYIVSTGLNWEDGYQAARNYSFENASPTAFISCNNLLARGALRGFLERGIRVPADLSLIGYDDLPELAHEEVPLTTVGPSLQEIARLSAEMIVQLTQDQQLEVGTRLIEPVLHERKSVARVPD